MQTFRPSALLLLSFVAIIWGGCNGPTVQQEAIVEGAEIYRAFGLLRDDPYAQQNGLGNPLYLNVSLNLVSP